MKRYEVEVTCAGEWGQPKKAERVNAGNIAVAIKRIMDDPQYRKLGVVEIKAREVQE